MPDRPAWLPEPFAGDPSVNNEDYDRLYHEVFCRDFKSSEMLYRGHYVWFFEKMFLGRELIFVHLTSRKKAPDTEERELRPERCARLPWVRPMIEHADDPAVLSWDYEEGDGDINTYVWLHEHDYVVIMKRMKDGSRRLFAAYCVDEHERMKFRKKYENRIKP